MPANAKARGALSTLEDDKEVQQRPCSTSGVEGKVLSRQRCLSGVGASTEDFGASVDATTMDRLV